ncbi:HupE/UreJ family protein [Synechococcus sp. RedBA-s]|uniref:HupE/UreJ family protein n=1 Tax=Synechococcus sp. RedBA-s TaxID=2823741 RepID=UPI0020CFA473|nr:HupE/UreJ family protein [Synechococcus sp. RedBA-s]MCP9800584.1 HupE/UreJ family protein [Synechococcus sp. RedBA-s]
MFDDFTLQSDRQVPGPDRLFLAPGCGPGGPAAGSLHPLLGTDHLLLLIAMGAAASYISGQL